MKDLSIDIETRSRLDLTEVGVYKYAEDCEVLLFGYSEDFGDVKVLDLYHGDKIPARIADAIVDDKVRKHAYNAQFERIVLSHYLKNHHCSYDADVYLTEHKYLNPWDWYCTMVHSFYCSLPSTLDALSRFMFPNNPEYVKDERGKGLIRKFSSPKFIDPNLLDEDSRADWQAYIEYNKQDVVAEMKICQMLEKFAPLPDTEHEYYVYDQYINDIGVRIDIPFAKNAKKLSEEIKYQRMHEWQDITGLKTPQQYTALRNWLTKRTGVICESVAKDKLDDFIQAVPVMPKDVSRAIEIKKELAKASIAKYAKALACVCEDGRCHGLFQFYGTRTGRFAGRLLQLQNIVRNSIEPLEEWRSDVMVGDLDYLQALTNNVPDTLSQLIRTMLIPKDGCEFVIADFHAIEAVLSAWLADEQWRLEVFRGDGRIYEASASEMFGVPASTITKPDGSHGENYALRAKGKVAELALGYGGGVGALAKMGGERMGLTQQEMVDIVDLWRSRSPNIVAFWTKLDEAVLSVMDGTTKVYYINRDTNREIQVYRKGAFLVIKLPSGRELFYCQPHYREVTTSWGATKQCLFFYGQEQTKRKWLPIATRGAKLFENIIQAIARDILCNAIRNIMMAGYDIVLHVHDEVCVESRYLLEVDELNALMCDLPEWGKDIPLTSAGFTSKFYRKD